jgi:hypothetical protein
MTVSCCYFFAVKKNREQKKSENNFSFRREGVSCFPEEGVSYPREELSSEAVCLRGICTNAEEGRTMGDPVCLAQPVLP